MKPAITPPTEELNRCVMCGLCLPHCPTYQQTHKETESPRGRITLMNALWQNKLAHDDTLEQHLNNCLSCRACEAVCPSGVKYGHLIDKTRQLMLEKSPKTTGLAQFALKHIHPHRSRLRLLNLGLWLYQRLGIRKLAQVSRIFASSAKLQRLDRYLPAAQTPALWQNYYPAKTSHIKDVALFLGCVSENIDPNTLRASIKLLTHLGYGVHIPAVQGCCGALHQHQGDHETAQKLFTNNANAFRTVNCRDVIAVATGCTSMLSEYPEQLNEPNLAWRAIDISAFLLKEKALHRAKFKPLEKTIAIHTPCSMTNVLKLKQASNQLLAHIPGAQLHSLSSNNVCCGAAGSYMLSHPEMADALLKNKIDDIHQINPDIIATTNIGCALHLNAGLSKNKNAATIKHPIEILAQQIINN